MKWIDLRTLYNDANAKVDSFTTDLDEARGLFKKVGVSLDELDLEPVAEVVEKLKENKDGLNDILDNLRGVDIEEYINQAKRIEWKQLLNSAEELMTLLLHLMQVIQYLCQHLQLVCLSYQT